MTRQRRKDTATFHRDEQRSIYRNIQLRAGSFLDMNSFEKLIWNAYIKTTCLSMALFKHAI